MKTDKSLQFNKKLIPQVSNRSLLFVAAVVWALAGSMLLTRGVLGTIDSGGSLWIKFLIGIVGGVLFYYFIFTRISLKHILRIKKLQEPLYPFYAFFNLKSYLMMAGMITLGITLRITGLVPMVYLSVFYVSMGLPLLLSSIRFLKHFISFLSRK